MSAIVGRVNLRVMSEYMCVEIHKKLNGKISLKRDILRGYKETRFKSGFPGMKRAIHGFKI